MYRQYTVSVSLVHYKDSIQYQYFHYSIQTVYSISIYSISISSTVYRQYTVSVYPLQYTDSIQYQYLHYSIQTVYSISISSKVYRQYTVSVSPLQLITDPPPMSFPTFSTNKKREQEKKEKNYMWHVTCDTWHVTIEIGHVQLLRFIISDILKFWRKSICYSIN